MARGILISMALVILIIIAGFSIHAYMDLSLKSRSLSEELERYKNDYAALQEKYNSLKEDYEALSRKSSNLTEIIKELNAKIEQLEEERKALNDSYTQLYQQLLARSNELESLNAKYSELYSKYLEIAESYADLLSRYAALQSIYLSLEQNYEELLSGRDPNTLEGLRAIAYRLNESLKEINYLLLQFSSFPYAFPRTLNAEVVKSLGGVFAAIVNRTDNISSVISDIYKWIRENVRYTSDPPIPVPDWRFCINNYCYYNYTLLSNYVQDPLFTAVYKQGDCEDQALLAYALIKYYQLYILKREFEVWIALINFRNGVGHALVILPISGGEVVLIDPTGAYLTGSSSADPYAVSPQPARAELLRYSQYWADYGGIAYIILYRVDVSDGSYAVVKEGDLYSIIRYIEGLAA